MQSTDWQPSATAGTLEQRALALRAARSWFEREKVLEVQTPTLVPAAVSDPAIESLQLTVMNQTAWLRTSPEYHMKRLLAASPRSIYQIGPVFRAGELGRLHHPEFTMIEWYRVDCDYAGIIDDTCALIVEVAAALGLPLESPVRYRYAELFAEHAGVDALSDDAALVRTKALRLMGEGLGQDTAEQLGSDRQAWLDLLLTHRIIPSLPQKRPVAITHYPADQAMLAELDPDDPRLALRFEVLVNGVELANGYSELRDAEEQSRRFSADNARREALGQATVAPDQRLLAALAAGLPGCSGVALGFDRLLMLCTQSTSLDAVVSFPPAT